MNKLRKRSIIALFNVLIFLFFFGTSQATLLFYYDAEGGVIEEELPHHQSSGVNFCQPECGSSNPNRGRIRDSISTPNGNKFFEWYCPDSTHDAWNTITVKGTYSIPLTLGKTYYLAYFMRFDALTSKQIWADDNGEKGVEIQGNGIRWVTSRGRNAAFKNIPDYHFTVYPGNPRYHLNPEEINDVFVHNRNDYNRYNPVLLEYGKWYGLVFRFDVTNTRSGVISLYINGTEILRYENIQFCANDAPTLSALSMGGTISQPSYNAGEHYRRFDALILTDNWQDIVDGGYLEGGDDDDTTPPTPLDDDTIPPGDVTNFEAQTGDSQVVLNWINPADSDFKGTIIRYRTDKTYPANYSDGIEVCNKTASPGTSDTHTLTGLLNGTTYYFSAFTYDKDDNYSKAAHISAMPYANVYTKTFGDISGSDFPGTCQDTYINKNDINYSDNSEAIRTYTWPTNSAANRIVMKWDLSAFPQNAIIQEATLSLYMYGFEGTGGDDNYEIAAHKIINHNPDISSCTWNTYDGSNSWTGGVNGGEQDMATVESNTIVDKTSGYKNWNITQMVQDWVNNPSENYGLMLNSDSTSASDSNRYFRPTEYSNQDQRPILTIKYGSSDIPKVPSAPAGLTVIGE